MKLLQMLSAPTPTEEPRKRAPMLARLGLTDKAIDPRDIIHERTRAFGKNAPEDSEDLDRIVALPRRQRPTHEEQATMAAVMTALLSYDNPNCQCAALSNEPCIKTLLPVQGWYTYEAAQVGGSLGHIIVGGGKTGINILLPMVVPGCKRAVLMLPPGLREQFRLDFLRWSQHFKVPNLAGSSGVFYPDRPTLDILAYSELSNANFSTWLSANKPQVIIADEAQALKDKKSVRTDRFLRYFIEHEGAGEIRFFPHSGTLTTDDLDNFCHLAALSLREKSPVPLETSTVRAWSYVLNPPKKGGGAAPIGALRKLCEVGETARDGFRRRLIETAGVITTEDAALPNKLVLIERAPGPLPTPVKDALKYVRERETRPDGEELVEALEVATVLRQLSYGFFYRWKYPHGEPAELIEEWFGKRQSWYRELREKLENRRELLDSPKLCTDAAQRFCAGYVGELPTWDSLHWPEWRDIAGKVRPEPDEVWIDDFLVSDAAAWGRKHAGIIWYQHGAFGRALARMTGWPRYGAANSKPENLAPTPGMLARRQQRIDAGQWKADNCENWIQVEEGTRPIIASIKAHHFGRNLQMFGTALVANMPDTPAWEQLLGRLHRRHQRAETVEFHVYQHTPEVRALMEDAREAARYVQELTGKVEKLLFAEWRAG